MPSMRIFRRTQTLSVAGALLLTGLLAAPASAAPAPDVPGANRVIQHCVFTPTPENPAARPVQPPSPYAFARGHVPATIRTNHGTLKLLLDRRNAPCAVHNLIHLAQSRFYDQTECFRLTNSARLGVLQCGDLIKQEVGGPGYKFDDEVTGKETYPRGTIAMGNQGPGTNGSEFFIVHSFANISPNYTVMGRVIHGMDVLDKIVAGGIIDVNGPNDGLPKLPVHILSIRLG